MSVRFTTVSDTYRSRWQRKKKCLVSGSRTFDTQDLPQHELTIRKNMAPTRAPARARRVVTFAPVRKNGIYNPPINRTSVGDEYGAGPPEVWRGSDAGVLRRGRKRDFSPCVYRGLGERSTRVREYASTRVREKSWWTLFGLTTKAGNTY